MAIYIVLMVLGFIIILLASAFVVFLWWRKRRLHTVVGDDNQTSEQRVNSDIASWARHHQCLFMDSALYKYGDGQLFEVDGILITDKVVVVFEVKSIRGIIRGDATGSTFIKILGEQTSTIANPIAHNDRNIKHIERMTNIKMPTISVIVYSNRLEDIEVTNLPAHALVIRHDALLATLDTIDSSLPVKITSENMHHIEKTIRKFATKLPVDIKAFRAMVGSINDDRKF